MTDQELLELAAKAAGLNTPRYVVDGRRLGWTTNEGISVESGPTSQRLWNPLNDDGDALRLAVKLNLVIRPQEKCCYVESNPESLLGFSSVGELQMNNDNPYAATRRAIVCAAAEIGSQDKRSTK